MSQPSILVNNASNITQSVFTLNPNGAAAAVDSQSVVLASNHPTVPVSLAAAPLPAGASTEATLATLNSKLPTLDTAGGNAAGGTIRVVLATDQPALSTPLPVSPRSSNTLTDRSGSVTTGSTAQNIMSASAQRRGFFFQNLSTTDLWIRIAGTASAGSGSLKIVPDGYYESPDTIPAVGLVSLFGTTTGQAFSCQEW